MHLLSLEIKVASVLPRHGDKSPVLVEPGRMRLDFTDSDGNPRLLTVIYGGSGAGKTSMLSALSCTRPGHCVGAMRKPGERLLFVTTGWSLGIDEPDRASALRLITPNAPPEVFERGLEQRREQSFFEGLAREGGFMFMAFSSLRWFSKPSVSITAPERTLLRYDVRRFEPLEDAARQDLARETKQTLAYAAIGEALPVLPVASKASDRARYCGVGVEPEYKAGGEEESPADPRVLGLGMRNVIGQLVGLLGYDYLGLDAVTLEARFSDSRGRLFTFDALPSQVKHLVGIGALVLKNLWAAYPGLDPTRAAGVVAVDQIELLQDESSVPAIIEMLRSLFPRVQWILTTRRPELLAACDPEEGVALRRQGVHGELHVDCGLAARVH